MLSEALPCSRGAWAGGCLLVERHVANFSQASGDFTFLSSFPALGLASPPHPQTPLSEHQGQTKFPPVPAGSCARCQPWAPPPWNENEEQTRCCSLWVPRGPALPSPARQEDTAGKPAPCGLGSHGR